MASPAANVALVAATALPGQPYYRTQVRSIRHVVPTALGYDLGRDGSEGITSQPRLRRYVAMRPCPSCQFPTSDDAAFCGRCGTDFAAGTSLPLMQAAGAFAPGDIVDRKYEIQAVLGEGGMGIVYVAQDIHTQMRVVVKAIRSEYAHREDFRERILAEGRALARIDHVNVVRLNAVVVEAHGLYLVMQFIDGEALDKTVERYAASGVPMPVAQVLRVFRQVLEGVGAAHQEGVIHRDIKPANILIRARDGVAKVTDFGIAKPEEDAKAGRGQTKGIIGSLLYMAPEQVTGQRDLDKRVDIYALGILLYELLTGRVPFDGESEFEIMKLHVEAQLPSVCAMRFDVPPFIDGMLQRACAKNRSQRYGSVEEMLAALDGGMSQVFATGMMATAQAGPIVPTAAHPVFGDAAAPMLGGTVLGEPRLRGVNASTTAGLGRETSQEASSGTRYWVAALLGLLALVGGSAFGAAYTQGWILAGTAMPLRDVPGTQRLSDAAVADAPRDNDTQSGLVALEGPWKSDSGKNYDAKLVGSSTLEFRLKDASGLRSQGYEDDETVTSLTIVPGESDTFNVEYKWRPVLPADLHYDLALARATCQQLFTSAERKPLRAQYDGTKLSVDVVKVDPGREFFITKGTAVIGCGSLHNPRISRIESVFKRP